MTNDRTSVKSIPTQAGAGLDSQLNEPKATRLRNVKKSGQKLKVKLSGSTRSVMSTLKGFSGKGRTSNEGSEGGL